MPSAQNESMNCGSSDQFADLRRIGGASVAQSTLMRPVRPGTIWQSRRVGISFCGFVEELQTLWHVRRLATIAPASVYQGELQTSRARSTGAGRSGATVAIDADARQPAHDMTAGDAELGALCVANAHEVRRCSAAAASIGLPCVVWQAMQVEFQLPVSENRNLADALAPSIAAPTGVRR